MDLLPQVVTALREQGIPFALIGAAAMAVHGVSRSTYDTDLFAVSRACLEPGMWRKLVLAGIHVDVRVGDDDDPLLGVVRISHRDQAIDVVVGRSSWQRAVLERTESVTVFGVDLPVVTVEDLILLKLYAGGVQDRWDIQQLLHACSVIDHEAVDARVQVLSTQAQEVWRALRG